MGTLNRAIEEFIKKRLAVYRADRQQIIRDTRAAERATRDHTGRWLFELPQNSDDAGASNVWVLVEDDAVYVADNGRGLIADPRWARKVEEGRFDEIVACTRCDETCWETLRKGVPVECSQW